MIEEVHRWIATVLIVGVVVLAIGVFRAHRSERRLTGPLTAVLGLLVLQVVLGGVTVLLKNVSWTVVIHYGAAALLVAALALVTVRLACPATETGAAPVRDAFASAVNWFAGLSFALLLIGSTVANTDSHTSCGKSFPLCNGTLVPTLNHHVVINLVHRAWAGVMLVFAVWLLWRSRRDRADAPRTQRAVDAGVSLYLVQAVLGIVVVAVGENTAVEIIHSSVASLTWAAVATLLALTRTLPARAEATPERRVVIPIAPTEPAPLAGPTA